MITNKEDIPLTLAVWAVDDDYDYVNQENYISVTQLIKPIKQIILGMRVSDEDTDVSDLINAALGTCIHSGIEKAWKFNYKKNLKSLGYSDELINKIKINPKKEDLKNTDIPIYIEQRNTIKVDDYTIGGKFDMVADGILHDNKSTSVYTWIYGGRDKDYCLQGSLYKLINKDIIKEDFIRINYIFTDWQKSAATQNEKYPLNRLVCKDIPLLSLEETKKFVEDKIKQIKLYKDSPEEKLPRCTDEDLWRAEPKYKYYADPTKTSGRSTKNFTSLEEANEYKLAKGNKGIVIVVPGEVKRCIYCRAYNICKQRREYFPND